ncbi:hypothetical protein B224_5327 [Aeromonas media WS]|nr:hypothetical protein B224_5327 [Aeromonas media WS]
MWLHQTQACDDQVDQLDAHGWGHDLAVDTIVRCFHHTSPRPVMTRSVSLMPMYGGTIWLWIP